MIFTADEIDSINTIKEICSGIGVVVGADDREVIVELCEDELDDYELLEAWEEIQERTQYMQTVEEY